MRLHEGDLIVVDFGTATTFDVVDYTGAYKGGIIAPGINLSLDALVAAAAKLPRVAIEAPAGTSVIGRTTEEQMHIGIYWGYVAMMEGLVARLRAEIGRPVKVDRHRRPRHPVRRPHRHFRRDRGRPHHPGTGDAVCAEPERLNFPVIPGGGGGAK